MGPALTLTELDEHVGEIQRETSRQMEAVSWEARAGDWEGLARRHREMLAQLRAGREELGRLRPPPETADAYQAYLQAVDRQLAHEERVLQAAEAADLTTYHAECRSLVATLPQIEAAAERAGLRSVRTKPAQRARVWLTLPWYALRAAGHSVSEQRAGRTWTTPSGRPAATTSGLLYLTAVLAVVLSDWGLKALAVTLRPDLVSFHVVDPPAWAPLLVLGLTGLVFRVTAAAPRSWMWVYGAALALGGALAHLIDVAVDGAETNFIRFGIPPVGPADCAMVAGAVLWGVGIALRSSPGRGGLAKAIRALQVFAAVCWSLVAIHFVARPYPPPARSSDAGKYRLTVAEAERDGARILTPALRDATFAFGEGSTPELQRLFLEAVASARPEAQRLFAVVDGLVEVRFGQDPRRGVAGHAAPGVRWHVLVDDEKLLGRRDGSAFRRAVLHELGHVVDGALVPDALKDVLDASIPRGQGCRPGHRGACSPRLERFADTFSKWALRDLSDDPEIGGYHVPPPVVPIDEWGAPLTALASS